MLLVDFCIKVDRFSFCEENISRAWLQLYSSEQKLNVFFVSFVKNEKRKSEIMSFQRRLNRLKKHKCRCKSKQNPSKVSELLTVVKENIAHERNHLVWVSFVDKLQRKM